MRSRINLIFLKLIYLPEYQISRRTFVSMQHLQFQSFYSIKMCAIIDGLPVFLFPKQQNFLSILILKQKSIYFYSPHLKIPQLKFLYLLKSILFVRQSNWRHHRHLCNPLSNHLHLGLTSIPKSAK